MQSDLSDFATHLRAFFGTSVTSYAQGKPACDDKFNALALELFSLQFRYNRPYRLFCQHRGCDPDALDQWSGIPAVPTSAFKELDLTSLSELERTTVFRSSGTTAVNRSRHCHSAESLALYEAAILPWFRKRVLPDHPQISFVSLTPPKKDVPDSSLVHMFDSIGRESGAGESHFAGHLSSNGEWAVSLQAAAETLKRCGDEPILLMGTAFNFVHLLDQCHATGNRFELPAGSRIFETGGYKGRSRSIEKRELHKWMSNIFGVPESHIVTEYGMSELSSQAYDAVIGYSDKDRSFEFPPWVRMQIISPETGQSVEQGQTGLIRVFDLANVWSVMAIQTEDLAIAGHAGFNLLGRATLSEPRGCSLLAP